MTRQRRASFAVAGLACAAAAVVLVAAVRPAPARPTAVGVPEARTPLSSVRRVPALLVRTVERAAHARAGAALTAKLTALVAPDLACVAVDSSVGSLARIGTDLALAPASTLKLLTATAAIDLLGSDHRFTTRVLSDSAGDLVVVGGGDPLLATPEYLAHQHAQPRFRNAPFTPLTRLADAVVAAGVRTVSGAVLVDDHAHDTLRFLPAWKTIYAQEGDIGSLGALTVDGGYVGVNDRTPAPDPALTTGRQLATMLAARGVTIEGGVRRGRAADGMHEVAHVESPPLSDIIGEMLTSSDNYTAEELLRDLAVGTDGTEPATTEQGTRVVEHELDAVLGVPNGGLVMYDGSGLAADDRVTCATMLRIIELATHPKFAAIDQGLAVAARTGTLADRFVGEPLAGILRAKTGSIAGVVGLVGIVDGPDDLRFAFLANGNFSNDAGAQLQAEVARAVGSTPDLRAPPDLVPAP